MSSYDEFQGLRGDNLGRKRCQYGNISVKWTENILHCHLRLRPKLQGLVHAFF